jgi:SOUL heme-binding protein
MQNHQHVAIPLTEKLKGVAGIFGIRTGEEPEYMLYETDGNKEVRAYLPYVVAHIEIFGEESKATDQAFLELTDYLFGKNSAGLQMQMTVPVLIERSEFKSKMCVVLPSKFSVVSAPTPDNANIKLESRPSEIVAAIEYSGVNSPEKISEKREELINWLLAETSYDVVSKSRIALYDPPLTIPFMRKNELHISVKASEQRTL